MPQWNCACLNCEAARAGRIPARTQSSVAVSADGVRWFLINASPDLGMQIGSFPPLQPRAHSARHSPLEAVLLTNADMDHILGLVALREGERVIVHATTAVRRTIPYALRLEELINAFCGLTWHEPTPDFSPLARRDGAASGLSARAIPLPGSPPPYARESSLGAEGHSIAWQISDDATGTRALIAPDVAAITPELDEAMNDSAAVLFDGTFWSDDELQRVKPSARTAAEMGHWPVRESLHAIGRRNARHKVYIHINNTNPMLAPDSPERAAVESAGITVGEDGIEFEL